MTWVAARGRRFTTAGGARVPAPVLVSRVHTQIDYPPPEVPPEVGNDLGCGKRTALRHRRGQCVCIRARARIGNSFAYELYLICIWTLINLRMEINLRMDSLYKR